MAITDSQMEELREYAERMGEDADVIPPHQEIIDEIFSWCEAVEIRTEDEFAAIITEADMPAAEDRRYLIDGFIEGFEGNT